MTDLSINSEHTNKYTAALTWIIFWNSVYFIHNMFQNIMAKDKVGGQVAYDVHVIYSKGVAKTHPIQTKQKQHNDK